MNQICIAKKLTHDNVDVLDFALDDKECLLIFENYKSAAEFLRQEVGDGEELQNYIITTTEAQKDNPLMIEILARSSVSIPDFTPVLGDEPRQMEEVEFTFLLDCEDFEIKDNEAVLDKRTGKILIPMIAFMEAANPTEPVPVDNFLLKAVYIDKLKQ